MSRKHKYITLVTVEDAYVATSLASCEAVWLQKLLTVRKGTLRLSGNKENQREIMHISGGPHHVKRSEEAAGPPIPVKGCRAARAFCPSVNGK